MICGSATMSPAVPPTTASVGSQWCPLPSWSGNSQIPFWSWRKSMGKLRQLTCRSDANSPPDLEACDTCEGLSGNGASAACAWILDGVQNNPAQMTRAKTDCFLGIRLIEFLGCGSLLLGVLLISISVRERTGGLSVRLFHGRYFLVGECWSQPFNPCPIYHCASACEIIIGLPEASKNMTPAFSPLIA
jgi:hypothetical protein